MSTNATITVVNRETGKASTIYNHWDGYPEGVGATLAEHYNSQELADKLVALGNVSNLDDSIDCPTGHTFCTPVRGFSVFYGRDRGEEDSEALVQDIDTFRLDDHAYGKQQYNYMFVDGKWIRATKIPAIHEQAFAKIQQDENYDANTTILELLKQIPDSVLQEFLLR
jgi:hypothetical protein